MSDVQWLTNEQQRAWRAYLKATKLLSAQLDRELQQQSKISHPYYEILVRLSENPERRLRMSDLATAADSSRSRLSHAISRLEAQGWVRRVSCANDRRGAWAELTDAGFSALTAAAPGHVETVRRLIFDRLDATQVEQLERICNTISHGMDGSAPLADTD
jgi:DNA-binding MarR family transcriptional regulator